MAQTVAECLTAAEDSVTVINDINTNGKKLYGLIAQEVKESLDKHNITDFGGWNVEEGSSIQAISQEMFVHPLIKAVQELSAKVEELENKLNGE